MAAAEVRAAWQRSASRRIVQEDPKRAPKLHPSPSVPQNDSYAEGGEDHQATHFMPMNSNPANHKLSPGTKWWLQLEPAFYCQKDSFSEKTKKVDDGCKDEVEPAFLPSKLSYESLHFDSIDLQHQEELFPDSSWMVSSCLRKHGSEASLGTKSTANFSQQSPKHNAGSGDYLSTEMSILDMGTPWSDSVKSEPWWHISDDEELALLVAQKSSELTENCDLPKPNHSTHFRGSRFSCPGNLEATRMIQNRRAVTGECNDDQSQNIFALQSLEGNSRSFDSMLNDDQLRRISRCGRAIKPEETSHSDPIRAELLEALCHSQTRARKAEMAAQKAYEEKEHIVKLLFRQASHLFAYKQWLHMLQLESLCLQLRIKEQQLSKIIQSPPWVTNRNKKKRKKETKGNFYRNAVALAVALGLAGAGLLLGWTLGWFFTAV